jgi:hypothetical protein
LCPAGFRKSLAIAGHFCFLSTEMTKTNPGMPGKAGCSAAARDPQYQGDRAWIIRYAILTLALFAPLLFSFVFIRNLYPFAASTMMMAGAKPDSGQTYYILRGETLSGATIDLPPVDLTNALSNVAFSLVSGTVENKSFSIRSPHPANAKFLTELGGQENLPPAARLPDLLRAWGSIYNARIAESSAQRLRAVQLDAYRWTGDNNPDRLIQSWRIEL